MPLLQPPLWALHLPILQLLLLLLLLLLLRRLQPLQLLPPQLTKQTAMPNRHVFAHAAAPATRVAADPASNAVAPTHLVTSGHMPLIWPPVRVLHLPLPLLLLLLLL
jgi:hypothetical protein